MTSVPAQRFRVQRPPAARPLLVFDGTCRFCKLWVGRWRGMTGDRVDYAPSQEVAGLYPEIPAEAFARSVIFITPEGVAYSGAEAVLRSLTSVPRHRRLLWLYGKVPAFAWLTERVYSFIAGHRTLASRATRLLWGKHLERPSFARARSLFLRLVGLVYLIAFVSLWVQVDGLVGEKGILPSVPFLESARAGLGASAYWRAPTLAWLHPGDAALHWLCGGGTALSVVVMLGLVPAPALALLWLFYLSLTTVCRTFLGFQWDNLLLEAGFLAIFLAPLKLRCRLDSSDPPPRLALWLVRWLLFRLMFSSGLVKLTAGDESWWNLTALDYHYWTQPIPNWIAWYIAKTPEWFLRLSCFVMFVVELGAPFLIAAPRRLRLAAFWSLVGLQTLIAATGNYAFFNMLTIVLCVPLLDDAAWPLAGMPGRVRSAKGAVPESERAASASVSENSASVSEDAASASASESATSASAPTASHDRAPIPPPPTRSPAVPTRGFEWPLAVTLPVALLVLVLSLLKMENTLRLDIDWPRPLLRLELAAEPFRSVNGYGLFRVMTKERPEIVVEGSRDGRTWLAYEFRWKPGDLARRPPFVAPHQPRLDWQMWFAALGDYRQNSWFLEFVGRLLEGSPAVVALLDRNPFPDSPPRFVRALRYKYTFTSYEEGRRTGAWWNRAEAGVYLPPVTLRGASGSGSQTEGR